MGNLLARVLDIVLSLWPIDQYLFPGSMVAVLGIAHWLLVAFLDMERA